MTDYYAQNLMQKSYVNANAVAESKIKTSQTLPVHQRIDWIDYFKKICLITSERSPCTRLKVGCLLVKDNRIVSQGYNGFLPGFPHKSIIENNHEIATIHAEQNTIIDCAKRGVSCDGCTAYITHYPCFSCTKQLIAAGIKKICYINVYKKDDKVAEFAEIANVNLFQI